MTYESDLRILIDNTGEYAAIYCNNTGGIFDLVIRQPLHKWRPIRGDIPSSISDKWHQCWMDKKKDYCYCQWSVGELAMQFLAWLPGYIGDYKEEALNKRWKMVAGIAGVVSIVSWTANTFLDFVQDPTLTYLQLLAFYVGVIIIVYAIFSLVQRKTLTY